MRDPAPGPGPLETFYRPFVEEGSLWPEPTPAGERYEAETLRQGQRDWLARMLDEYRAMLDFTELLSLASRAFLPLESVGAITRLVRDEARHVELCRGVAAQLGPIPEEVGEPLWKQSEPERSPRQRMLSLVVGTLCVRESLSVAMLAGVRDSASDELARATLSAILRDEAAHGRIGFGLLEVLMPRMHSTDHDFLAAAGPRLFRSLQSSYEEAAQQRFRRSPFGARTGLWHLETFLRITQRVVIPKLEAAGLPARVWWSER